AVALYTSAWIEIRYCKTCRAEYSVALYTSAWIEMPLLEATCVGKARVALYTSAWIEIIIPVKSFFSILSHSIRVRGLKCQSIRYQSPMPSRRTLYECVD